MASDDHDDSEDHDDSDAAGGIEHERDRDDSGQFTEEFPREAFIDAVDALEDPTTKAVAEHVGCSRPTAHNKLTALAEEGAVERRKIGPVAVWSVPAADEPEEG